MALTNGVRLGPYEIVSLIGTGGMGEVYKARDTRLDRAVAIKLLPTELAERPDRRARFEAEARAISALNHPHICTLFDIGDAILGSADGGEPTRLQFLVMEYLEGETLDDRLTRGPLPARDVLRYAVEIVDALDHAHRERIVHRDLKPSNVMLTAAGTKLLDFGLAKDVATEANASMATLSYDHRKLTAEGTIIGTFQYMAPEQLEGKAADTRTDIFAFGAVLYEMATGRKAFTGSSQASLIASILAAEAPSITATVSGNGGSTIGAMAALDHIVVRCLAKQPDERWQSARDVKLEMEWIANGGDVVVTARSARQVARPREMVAWALAAAAIVATGALASVAFRPATNEITRFVVTPPAGMEIGVPENRTRLAVSPDGRKLVFASAIGGNQQLWLRALDSLAAQPLAGTEGAVSPFWSPDSRFIGFFSPGDGELKKVDAAGGAARTISAASMEGAPVWGADNTILFTQFREGIFRVSGDGGTPSRITTVDKTKRELNHYWPTFLPDGRHFLYMATGLGADGLRATPSVYIASFDSPETKLLTRSHSRMTYAPGHLLFVQDGALFAQPFDIGKLGFAGEPMQIADGIGYVRTLGNGAFSVSANGVLAYLGSDDPSVLVWFDRLGRATDPGWGAQNFGTIRFSPDALRVATDIVDRRTGAADVWIYDVARGVPVRFTTDVTNQNQPIWSPDGARVLFRWERGGSPNIYAKAVATGAEQLVVSDPNPLNPADTSADGRWIVYDRNTRQTGRDIWLMPMNGDGKARAFSDTRFDEFGARFSPDSQALAFVSTESGPPEVYVAPLLAPADRQRVSSGGGTSPRWRGDGRELFYTTPDNREVMSVSIGSAATSFKIGRPTHLFAVSPSISRDRARNVAFDVWPDGQRFLVGVPAGEPTTSRITVVLNWTSALTR